MRADERFEYPLPIIKVDIEKIIIKTEMDCEGEFTILNEGGGLLSGTIDSNFKEIMLTPKEFEGNKITVKYKFNLDNYKQGDILQTDAVIVSNGGELQIPIVIKITNHGLLTKKGDSLLSLKEFAQYAKKYPTEAKHLFISHDFIMWLSRIGYEQMEILDNLMEDSNKDRALDNFLASSRQKKKATVEVKEKVITVDRVENENRIITCSVPVTRVGWGYLDIPIQLENSRPWINLVTKKLSTSMFKSSEQSFITFEVDTSKIKNRFECESILIEADTLIKIQVHVRCKKRLSVMLSKNCFENEETGELIIENRTGKDLMIGVTTSNNYIKFEAKSYMVGKHAKIPFQIKITTLQNAQLAIKKQPTVISDILVKTIIDDAVFKEKFEISIGNLLNKVSFL